MLLGTLEECPRRGWLTVTPANQDLRQRIADAQLLAQRGELRRGAW
jgi:hypothetical protein